MLLWVWYDGGGVVCVCGGGVVMYICEAWCVVNV